MCLGNIKVQTQGISKQNASLEVLESINHMWSIGATSEPADQEQHAKYDRPKEMAVLDSPLAPSSVYGSAIPNAPTIPTTR